MREGGARYVPVGQALNPINRWAVNPFYRTNVSAMP
jgi:hypothetical protein